MSYDPAKTKRVIGTVVAWATTIVTIGGWLLTHLPK